MPDAAPGRYHALDGLRASMMLLGLFLHASISYVRVAFEGVWPFRDASSHPFFDVLLIFIHIFRMPVFYVMAGFFAALLLERRGTDRFVRNRVIRILLPFVAGWIVVFPLTRAGFVFANVVQRSSFAEGWRAVIEMVARAEIYKDSTAHLWFLYYLLMLYLVALVVDPLVRRLPDSWRSGTLHAFTRLLKSRWRPIYLAVPTALTLYPMSFGEFETDVSFVPDPKVVLAYGVFFAFGWLLYRKRDLVPSLARHAWWQVGFALLLTPVNILALRETIASLPRTNAVSHAITVATGALIAWLLVFGFSGLFLRYLDRPIPSVRYTVDASYWLYLIHLPFMIWIPGLITRLQWPALVKVPVVLAISLPSMWLTYELFVRNTIVGKVLNGRRYPHGLPPRQ